MFLKTQNTTQLLNLVTIEDLYVALIQQLNKDFTLSNIDVIFSEATIPSELKNQLHTTVDKLVQNDFDSFLNLVYRIDLPESKVRKNPDQTFESYVEMVVFSILKRECQKVWLKKNFS